MNEDCPHCVFEITEANCPGCFEGSHYKPKQMTNADRIRSLSDEELAVFLTDNACPPPFNGPRCKRRDDRYSCHDCWLDWLKEEAKASE